MGEGGEGAAAVVLVVVLVEVVVAIVAWDCGKDKAQMAASAALKSSPSLVTLVGTG